LQKPHPVPPLHFVFRPVHSDQVKFRHCQFSKKKKMHRVLNIFMRCKFRL